MASLTPLEMTAWVVADDDNVCWAKPSAMSVDLRARRYYLDEDYVWQFLFEMYLH